MSGQEPSVRNVALVTGYLSLQTQFFHLPPLYPDRAFALPPHVSLEISICLLSIPTSCIVSIWRVPGIFTFAQVLSVAHKKYPPKSSCEVGLYQLAGQEVWGGDFVVQQYMSSRHVLSLWYTVHWLSPSSLFLMGARWLQQFQATQTHPAVYKDWRGELLHLSFFLPGDKTFPTIPLSASPLDHWYVVGSIPLPNKQGSLGR